jgi:hypothetical protein
MKLTSRNVTTIAASALFALTFFATTKADAEDWCRINEHNLYSCGFASKEQCQAMTSGRTGMCNPNPFPGKPAAHHPIVVFSSAELKACESMKLDCVGGGRESAFAYLPKKGAAHRTK